MATSAKAVNKPTDEKAKELDVNAKLQLYGIYSGKLVRTSIARYCNKLNL